MKPSVLPFLHSWPAADRVLWEALTAPALGPLDDAGALSHLRPPSLRNIAVAYDRWLGWLKTDVPVALDEPPVHRGTPERLLAWTASLTGLAPMSRWFYLDGALRLMIAAAPEMDWSPHRRIRQRLRQDAFRNHGHRKQDRVLSSEVLLQAGLELAGPGADGASTPLRAMMARRDGLIVAFLALLPLRITSFCTLELGRSVLRVKGGWVVAVEGHRMKAGRPWEAPLPSVLVEPFTRYVDEVRPRFTARAKRSHQWLWVHHHGGSYKAQALGEHISDVTEKLVGVRVTPHLFRDAAATTAVQASPDAARLIRPLLAHANYATAERHYVHAQGIEAGRQYTELIARLRDEVP